MLPYYYFKDTCVTRRRKGQEAGWAFGVCVSLKTLQSPHYQNEPPLQATWIKMSA